MKTKLVIFGITGDLGKRKLLPALGHIFASGKFDNLEVIGVSRRDVDPRQLLAGIPGTDALADKLSIFTMDLSDLQDYVRLKEHVALQEDEQLLLYLSVPPSATRQIVDRLGEAGLNSQNVKLMFEKPFGFDLTSSKEVISDTAKYFHESQVYRIDHYLAKEMAQNIVVIRGANAIFRHIWNNHSIESINITAAESIDIEGRVQFYEQTGALRDVLQGHLLQLLALTIADIPENFDWQQLPKLRLDALSHVKPADPEKTIRAQYDGYEAEVGNPDSQTETFVSMELESDAEQWRGVPFYLATGKALDKKVTEICINLRPVGESQNNRISLRIQPDEGISMDLFVKKPGYEKQVERKTFDLNFSQGERLPDAYEQVFVDAIEGRKSLFASSHEVLRAWEIIAPVQQAWAMHHHDVRPYKKGSRVADIRGNDNH